VIDERTTDCCLPFSIRNRIELSATCSAVVASSRGVRLSVSATGSNCLQHVVAYLPRRTVGTFSIRNRIELSATILMAEGLYKKIAAFSIRNRIELSATIESHHYQTKIPTFSIRNRIELSATPDVSS